MNKDKRVLHCRVTNRVDLQGVETVTELLDENNKTVGYLFESGEEVVHRWNVHLRLIKLVDGVKKKLTSS